MGKFGPWTLDGRRLHQAYRALASCGVMPGRERGPGHRREGQSTDLRAPKWGFLCFMADSLHLSSPLELLSCSILPCVN